jgi:hypothetical protein
LLSTPCPVSQIEHWNLDVGHYKQYVGLHESQVAPEFATPVPELQYVHTDEEEHCRQFGTVQVTHTLLPLMP